MHVGHSLLHSLQHLSLHDEHLLQCWWWRRVGIVVVVLMSVTVTSVGHLMIMKRFEIEVKIKKRFPTVFLAIMMIEILFR
jgi:hypothetical protein